MWGLLFSLPSSSGGNGGGWTTACTCSAIRAVKILFRELITHIATGCSPYVSWIILHGGKGACWTWFLSFHRSWWSIGVLIQCVHMTHVYFYSTQMCTNFMYTTYVSIPCSVVICKCHRGKHETNEWDLGSAGDWLCAVILDINYAGFSLLDC